MRFAVRRVFEQGRHPEGVLRQALARFLERRGWTAAIQGQILIAEREGTGLVVGFLRPKDVAEFAERWEDSPAQLAAVFLEPLSGADTETLRESGIECFMREEIEDLILADWTDKPEGVRGGFLGFLERG